MIQPVEMETYTICLGRQKLHFRKNVSTAWGNNKFDFFSYDSNPNSIGDFMLP